MARPSTYSEDIAQQVCERLFSGELLQDICGEENMPSRSAVWRWGEANPEFRDAFVRARAGQGHAFFERALDRSRKPLLGEIVKVDHEGNEEITTKDAVDRARLEVDTLKWAASKLAPKDYGDKQFVEHSGSLTLVDATEEDLIEELLALVASGRLVLPNGAQLETDDEPEEEDHSDLA